MSGSKPETGTSKLSAVDAGMSKKISSSPGFRLEFALRIAWRRLPGPESAVLVTAKLEVLGLVVLTMIKVATLIEPRVAPPAGWPSVRLTVLYDVGLLGLARIGTVKLCWL